MRLFSIVVAAAAAGAAPSLNPKTCFTKPAKHLKGKLTLLENPGFGTGEVKPFETVYKDGYFQSECVRDDMLEFADKHGKNRHAYKADNIDVSIVRYADVVAKEDQEKMTPDVCFDFCRTIQGAGFFGLHNGRDCYCTPYYKKAAGDSSECDASCDGAPHLQCGGKTKSAVFAMHACNDSVQEVKDIATFAGQVSEVCNHRGDAGLLFAVEALGDDLKKRAGKVGDEAASNNGQAAVVFSGKMKRAAEAATKIAGEIDDLKKAIDEATAAAGEQTGALSVENQRKADAAKKKWAELLPQARKACSPVKMFVNAAPAQQKEGAADQFVGMNYFTKHRDLGRTTADMPDVSCKGDILLSTAAHSLDQCASICASYGDNASDNNNRCVAFEYYLPTAPFNDDHVMEDFMFDAIAPLAEDAMWPKEPTFVQINKHHTAQDQTPGGLCTILGDVNEINVYTKDCAAPSFMQLSKKGADATIRCAGHLASLKGFDHRVNSKKAGVDQVEVRDFDRCF